MKKAIYITVNDLKNDLNHGINIKIFSQINSLRKFIPQVDYIYKTKDKVVFNDDIELKLDKNYFRFKKIENLITESYDFVYIRYPIFDYYLLLLLKKFKKNEKIKIVLEIPTYPITNLKFPIKIVDRFFYIFTKKYIDKIITYQQEKTIWGKETIRIINGINPKLYEISKKQRSDTINLISVSGIFKMHGIDRVIKGIGDYYKHNNKKVIFHIVGEGPEKNELKELVKELNLEKYIFFYGLKKGKELEELYDVADIGIGSLSLFREKLIYLSSLKTKEYCIKGLPFVISYKELAFPDECEYIYKVKDDSSNIDINKLVNWFERLKISKEMIRKYGEENLTWDYQIKKILKEIM